MASTNRVFKPARDGTLQQISQSDPSGNQGPLSAAPFSSGPLGSIFAPATTGGQHSENSLRHVDSTDNGKCSASLYEPGSSKSGSDDPGSYRGKEVLFIHACLTDIL
jgi:hypothetical protein